MERTFNITITVSQDSANTINIDGLHNKFIVSGDNSGSKRIIIFFFNPDTGKYEDGMNISVGRLSWRNAIDYALSFDYDINSEEDDDAEIGSDCLDEICSFIKKEFGLSDSEKFWTADRETGSFIESFDSISNARKAIEGYEEQDKVEGIYTPNFYDIVDKEHDSVIR